jgi:diguanylate cyclase (GGDEF)-like protein
VSRRHARFEPLPGGGHRLLDLGSTNGTFVNDRRISATVLELFDRVRVGEHVLVYLDPLTSAAKVAELMSPGETGALGTTTRSALGERLMGLVLLVQERGCDPELGPILVAALDELLAASGCTRAALVAQEGDLRSLRLVESRGDAPPLDEAALRSFAPAVEAALDGARVRAAATALDVAPDRPTLIVPMESRPGHLAGVERRRHHAGDVRGALLVAGPDAWTPTQEEEALLRAFTRHIAVLLSNARLERQATVDPLTGLPNRGHIEQLLAEEARRAREGGASLAVVLLDVDDFKRVNDERGHAAGDAALRHLGERLRAAVRATDLAGRWGGEEFLLALPGEGLEGASEVAHKVVRLIAASPTRDGLRITVSAGVAVAPRHGDQPADLLRRADLALYEAKRAGKDRVCVYHDGLELDASRPRTAAAQTLRLKKPTLHDPAAVAWLDCELLPTVALLPGVLTVGRSPECDVVLPHRTISRRHGRLHVTPTGGVTYEDASRNGTTHDGHPVLGVVAIRPGERLTLGPYSLRLRTDPRDALDITPEQTPARAMVRGQLEQTDLCALLLLLEQSSATGALLVRAEGLRGELRLKDGAPVSARAGDLGDVEAVRLLLAAPRGTFVLCRDDVTDARSIAHTMTELLSLACGHVDHAARAAGVLETARLRPHRPRH